MPCFGSYQRCIGSSILPPKRHGRPHVTCGYRSGIAVKAFKIHQQTCQRTSSPSIGSWCRRFCVNMITNCPRSCSGCQGICTRGDNHSTRSQNSSSPPSSYFKKTRSTPSTRVTVAGNTRYPSLSVVYFCRASADASRARTGARSTSAPGPRLEFTRSPTR